MKPVARVRGSSGSRTPGGFGESRSAALRGRFERLLRGGAESQGLPAVMSTLSSAGAPPPPPGRSVALGGWIEHPQAMPWAAAASALVEPRDAKAATEPLPASAQTVPALTLLVPNAGVPGLDAVPVDAARAAGKALAAADSAEASPSALPPPLQVAAPSTPGTAMNAQPLRPLSDNRGGDPRSLPELVRDLVQAVVHLSRGRAGEWRLTMALKPQVLEGTVVTLSARPGRLHVRFACSDSDARARVTAVQDDLQRRLIEALSAAQAVDVRVDVRALTTEDSHDVV